MRWHTRCLDLFGFKLRPVMCVSSLPPADHERTNRPTRERHHRVARFNASPSTHSLFLLWSQFWGRGVFWSALLFFPFCLCLALGAKGLRGMRKPQLDGDLRRIRSGGFLYHSCHDLNRSNAKMITKKQKSFLRCSRGIPASEPVNLTTTSISTINNSTTTQDFQDLR